MHENDKVLDHIEMEKQAFTMGQRCPEGLSHAFENFSAVSTAKRSVYCYLANTKMSVRDEASSMKLFKQANDLRGRKGWSSFVKKTGVKGLTLAEAGSRMYGITPDPKQNQWRRFDYCRMHLLGIVDNLFRYVWFPFPLFAYAF